MATHIDFFSVFILKALVIPFHEKKSQKPDMPVWKSLPLHQSRVWIFRKANRAAFSHTIQNSSPI